MFSERFMKFIEIWQKEFVMDKTIDEKVCVDKDGNPIPWYTFPAIEYLSQFNYLGKKVFEFGCGNSSRFWAARADKVISVEDNIKWLDKWKEEFTEQNINILYREEGAEYYNAILETEDKYDIIVIDGKNRSECAENAMKRLADGGIIIVDDSDRINTSNEYVETMNNLKKGNFIQVDFYGFCPMTTYTKTTSLFLSRNFAFESLYEVQPISGTGNIWHMSRGERKKLFRFFKSDES